MERMGGYGRVVSANFGGRRQNFAINEMMNPRKTRSVLLTASVKDMLTWASEAEAAGRSSMSTFHSFYKE